MRLAPRVVRRDRIGPVRSIAGADADIAARRGRGAVVVLDVKTLEVLQTRTADLEVDAPYIPGLLALRELPLLLAAFRKLSLRPDLLFVDGSGILHPRRFGLACHLGLLLDVPTIGCAKSPFIGEHDAPGPERGSWSPVFYEGERLGAAVRTRDGVRPVFVSTGHRVSLPTAVRWVLRAAEAFRMPEPIRAAHIAAVLPGK